MEHAFSSEIVARGNPACTETQVERLALIKRMKPLGFTVEQMADLLAAHDALQDPGTSNASRTEAREQITSVIVVTLAAMAYDEQLAARIRTALADTEGVEERKMFGGIAFLHHGNMVCGVVGESLMLRLGAERAEPALDEPHARPMDFTGRPMRGMVYVDPPGFPTDATLAAWVERALGFAATLPPKR